ncbi:Rid family detoxifying hydrolase [Flagellimonas halotolerans]|uniref:Rid family detoxifying hydrolase n=1 Tax=Flagellimonas halotolerans TaxID=3112164 RepID=A0ABU6IQ97_9FLAO|nr:MULTISPECIES: Rid family detoxifying hydrolase [unclassified Allomuricauda]MEC3965338.1 Rid family detoxifying hydrolase [Muricauda sp. SYSU M86414]MEC4265204.1 Rid family detoxifying hydrolase [Muricauda sp. SYSU M84420]
MKPFHYAILSILISGAMATSYAQETTEIIFHKSHEPKKQSAPFSDVVQAGNMYFLAGQIGMDHTTRTLVQGGVKAETEQAIKNIEAVLAQHDMTLDHVVKCTVILADIDDFSAFNEIYTQYFIKKPARTTFAAKGIAANGSIEIDVIAVK